MSLLSVVPNVVSSASADLEELGIALQSAKAVAAARTSLLAAPAADEVSAAIAALLDANAREFQHVSVAAAAYHDQFVQLLNGAAAEYFSAETANVQQILVDAVNAPAQALFGHPVLGAGAAGPALPAAAAASAAAPYVAVPLRMEGTHPVVDISLGGGFRTPVVVDTGSKGLVVPWTEGLWPAVGNIAGSLNPLSWLPTGGDFLNPFAWARGAILNPLSWISGSVGIVHGSYASGLEYWALRFPTTVNFGTDVFTGGNVVTGQTEVTAMFWAQDVGHGGGPVMLASAPEFLRPVINPLYSFIGFHDISEYFGNASGVLGIGPHAPGPGPNVVTALPSPLNGGAVIDQPDGLLWFGPRDAFGLGTWASYTDAPFATVGVSINGGALHANTAAVFDSGGGYGSIPQSLVPGYHAGDYLPAGTRIAVYNTSNQLLYSYTTQAAMKIGAPTDLFNTGNAPFALKPWWIGAT